MNGLLAKPLTFERPSGRLLSPVKLRFGSVALLAWLAASPQARAAADTSLSFAFAAQAGSGIYSIEGRVVQIYRIPVDFTVRPLEDDSVWGAVLGVPVTLGFYDYTTADLLEGDFPSHVGTASLLPGVEFPVRALDRWTLYPHADAGAAKDFSGDNLVWIYDTGVRSIVSFPAGSWNARAGQELLWAGAAQTGNALTDWYAEAMAGFEFRHDLPWSSGSSRIPATSRRTRRPSRRRMPPPRRLRASTSRPRSDSRSGTARSSPGRKSRCRSWA
jgi:hypothetical protein